MTPPNIDPGLRERLQQLIRTKRYAKYIFDALAAHKKSRATMDVYRVKLAVLRAGHQLTNDELHDFFQDLQRFDCGKLKIRQLPLHSSFTWSLDLVAVVDAVQGTPAAPVARRGVASPSGLRVFAPLRNQTIQFTLPVDFNLDDARSLSQFFESVARQNQG